MSTWPATAVNTEAVRSFFLPTRYKHGDGVSGPEGKEIDRQ